MPYTKSLPKIEKEKSSSKHNLEDKIMKQETNFRESKIRRNYMTYYKSLPKIENEKSLSSKHNLEDKIMKQVSEKEINILLARLRIPIKIVKLLNTELIYKDIEKRTDFIGLTENNELINIEFQSTKLKKEDRECFGTYTLLTRIKR